MARLTKIFESYLEHIDRLKTIPFGESDTKTITKQDNLLLSNQLKKQTSFNNNLILIYVILICVIFVIGIIFIFHLIQSPEKIGLIFGGTFLSLVAVVDRIRRIWKEKSIIDVIMVLATNLPPEQTAVVVQALYWKDKQTHEK